MSYPDALIEFEQLQPGDRVEVIHEMKVGFRTWHTTTVGTVVRTDRRRHCLHYQRNFDDKVFSDILVLKRQDGELTTVTLDEFSQLRKLDPCDDILALAKADPSRLPQREIAFTPARVIMQDFTGVPAIVDLAAMRDAMAKLGGDPGRINPLIPAELVIDHSVMVDHYGSADALNLNALLEFQRNRERYTFLRWGQSAFDNFSVVPPDTGIVHQVNLEHLARVVFTNGDGLAYPDTVVGTDSHTTMINGVGVLGWGVGGIEAEAAMLGQPSTMLTPEVVGVKLTGRLAEGATATDLVLTVTEMLRKHGVVEKFVEFFGDGGAGRVRPAPQESPSAGRKM